MRKEENKEKQGEIPIKPKKRRNNEENREKNEENEGEIGIKPIKTRGNDEKRMTNVYLRNKKHKLSK